MVKNTIIMILEMIIYGIVMDYFGLLTEVSLAIGIIGSLALMAITKLDDIHHELKQLYGALAVIFVGLNLDEQLNEKKKHEAN